LHRLRLGDDPRTNRACRLELRCESSSTRILGREALKFCENGGCDVPSSRKTLLGVRCNAIEVCRAAAPRCFRRQDHEHGALPPSYAGIVVLRLSGCVEKTSTAPFSLLALAATRSPVGKLWIVDDRRIREFVEEDDGP
jgi:hypothetical protein